MSHVRRANWIWVPTAIVVALQLWMLITILSPHRAVGFARNGLEVLSVRSGLAMDRAGIRPGDRLADNAQTQALFRDMSLSQLTGPYHIVVHRGSSTFQAILVPSDVPGWRFRSPDALATQFASAITFIVSVGIATWLFTLRPSPMTGAFYLASWSPGAFDQFFLQAFPVNIRIAVEIIYAALFNNASILMLLVFALRFPDDRPTGWRIYGQYIALGIALICITLNIVVSVSMMSSIIWLEVGIGVMNQWIAGVALLAALAILVKRMHDTEGATHARLRWALVGITIPLVLTAADDIAYVFNRRGFGYAELIPQLSYLVLPFTVAYVLTRARFVDPRFSINRAAVLSATGILLLLAVTGVDWLSSRLLIRRGLGETFDAASAIALGFGLRALHHRLERSIERLVFRAKHRAEDRLREVGSALRFATAEAVIDEALVESAARELRLASAALFRRNPGSGAYLRSSSVGWEDDCPIQIDENDQAVRLIKSRRGVLNLSEWNVRAQPMPRGIQEPQIAVPVLQRDELAAIVLYGGHRDQTKLDVSEIDLLLELADRSSAALDHIEAVVLRRTLDAQLLIPTSSSRTRAIVMPATTETARHTEAQITRAEPA